MHGAGRPRGQANLSKTWARISRTELQKRRSLTGGRAALAKRCAVRPNLFAGVRLFAVENPHLSHAMYFESGGREGRFGREIALEGLDPRAD